MRRLVLADARRLAGGSRRTTVTRIALALALVGLLALTVGLLARGETGEPPLDEAGRTTILVVDVSSSIQPRVYRQIGATIDRAIEEGGQFGVVLFSDTAYEMLPPGTDAIELTGLRQYFTPLDGVPPGVETVSIGSVRFPQPPWHESLTRGTRISTGLWMARDVLRREGVADGKVVLVSDLENEFFDIAVTGELIATYAAEGLPLRIVALSPSREDKSTFERFVRDAGSLEVAAPPPSEDGRRRAALPSIPFPVWLAVLGIALAFALASNEHLLARLTLRAGEGGK